MILNEEQLNFLARLNLQGPLAYDSLGDRLGCDEKAKEQCEMLEGEGYIYKVAFGHIRYAITEKGLKLVSDRTTYRI